MPDETPPPFASGPRSTRSKNSRIVEVWKLGFEVPMSSAYGSARAICRRRLSSAMPPPSALKRGDTFYTHKRGIPELRQALIDYHQRIYRIRLADDRIAVTSAGMNAMMLAMECLVGAGDNAVCVTPVWPNIFATIEIMGAAVRHLPLDPTPTGWQLDLDRLFAACDAHTRVIYLASPGNPSGWVMPRAQQLALLEFVRKRGIWIVADEVYARIVYLTARRRRPRSSSWRRPTTPSSSSTASPRLGDDRLAHRLDDHAGAPHGHGRQDHRVQHQRGATLPAGGCVAALQQGEPFVAEMVARYRTGRDLVLQRLGGMPRVGIVRPEAAFYLMFGVDGMTDCLEFAKRLVTETHVGLAPGSAFGPGGEGHLRLCFAASLDRLSQAMDRLEPFLN